MRCDGWTLTSVANITNINGESYSVNESWDYVNYLDTGNITRNRIDKIEKITVGSDKLPSRARRKVKSGDIVYSTVRPNQQHYGIIKKPVDNMLVSTGFAVIKTKEELANNDFLYWYLTQQHLTDYLHTVAENSTSAYPSIKPSDISKLKLWLPPLPEQRVIARILSSLDDKIELNNRMNKTLEEIAQSLFKRWFVDFEFPDENGNPYKPSGGKMVESELGPIPEGWKYDRLGQYIRIRTGKKDANVSSSNGLYPFFTCAQGELLCDEYSFDAKAIIVAGNGNFSVKWYKGKFEAYQRTYVIDPFDDNFFFLVYYTLIGQIDSFTQGARGSVIKFLTMKNFTDSKVIIPSNSVIKLFHMIITSLQENIFYNKKEIITLSQLRDTLLPKLMSGEIRVPITED